MTTLRDRLERGYGMRAERLSEGFLLIASFMFDDLRPAYLAIGLIALQVLSPFLSPIALVWSTIDRRIPPDRLGNLYFDMAGSRGACAISSVVLLSAVALIRWTGLHGLGRVMLAMPAASCILAATVGFCAGCGHYVLGRDLLVRAGVVKGMPEGACDVDVERG
jgi:hypothetical protein